VFLLQVQEVVFKTELKQYQTIQDRTVLEHTIDRLNALPLLVMYWRLVRYDG
jgi:hypothetical protein